VVPSSPDPLWSPRQFIMCAQTTSSSDSQRALELLEEGRRLMRLRQSHISIPMFNEAYQLDPDNPDIRFQMGSVARLQGELPLALQHLTFCLEHTPERVEVWLRLGEVLSFSRRYREGVAVTQRAVERHPENGRIWWRHGRMLRYNQSLDMALDALQRAVTAPSVKNRANFDLACVLQHLGETGKARKIFEDLANESDIGLLGVSA